MVFLKDQEWVFRNKAAVTATGSTTYKDMMKSAGDVSLFGQDNPLAFVLTIHEDAVIAVGDETYNFKLTMADSSGGSNAVNVIDQTIPGADLKAGKVFAFTLPNLKAWKRWWRVTHTLTGGSPTPGVTYSASVDLLSNVAHYVQHTSVVGV